MMVLFLILIVKERATGAVAPALNSILNLIGTKRMKRIIIFLLIILSMWTVSALADSRGYGFLMLEEPTTPKNIAMGSVGTALGGAGFRYYNPVTPFFTETSYVTAEFGQNGGGLNMGGFESALVFPEWFSAVSFHTSSVDFETRDERGFGVEATSTTTVGAVGAGYIRDNLSAGASLNVVEDRIWVEAHYTAFALSAGLGYKMLDKKLNLGAAGFYGVGWSRGYGDSASASVWQKGQIPKFARAGAAWIDTLKSFPYTAAADVVYTDEDKTFTVPVGISVHVLPVIDLRVGKRIGWESEVMSLGIGLNIDRIAFDAAFVPSVLVSDYEIKWSMALTYKLGGAGWRKKKPLVMPPVEVKAPIDEDEDETVQEEDSIDADAGSENTVNEVDGDIDSDNDNDVNSETEPAADSENIINNGNTDADPKKSSDDINSDNDNNDGNSEPELIPEEGD